MVKSIEDSVREIILSEYYKSGTTREEMLENIGKSITALIEKREREFINRIVTIVLARANSDAKIMRIKDILIEEKTSLAELRGEKGE